MYRSSDACVYVCLERENERKRARVRAHEREPEIEPETETEADIGRANKRPEKVERVKQGENVSERKSGIERDGKRKKNIHEYT